MRRFSGASFSSRRRLIALSIAFLLGGCLYYTLEILWRGYSHVTMWFCGAICLSGIFQIEEAYQQKPLYKRALFSALFITAMEFVFGCIFNLWLRLEIWDYSHTPLNLLGQICLPYSILWFFLAFPAAFLCKLIRSAVGLYKESP